MKRARPNLFSLNPNSSDDDSGENLMEDLESDYVAIPELDHYDENILDHREYGAIDPKARRAAETEIDARLNNNQTRVADQLDDFGHEGSLNLPSIFERNRRRSRTHNPSSQH
jgi:DNA replication licensing factor MCM2